MRSILVAFIAFAVWNPARAEVSGADDVPSFSQDRYGEAQAVKEEKPAFSQDKFTAPEPKFDYTTELRDVSEKGHEWSEVEIAKGIVQLNAKRYPQARAHFEEALKKDPRNFVAREYLAAIYEDQGNLNAAVEQLVRAKHLAPSQRNGVLNFRIGYLFFRIGHVVRARTYLRLAVDEKGFVTHAYYLLAQLDLQEKNYVLAERELHEALLSARRPGARAAETDLLQAIYYYLGECYARLGYFDSAAVTLSRAEPGGSWEIRNAAWRLHSEVNESRLSAGVGLFGQYDSNVVDLPEGSVLPQDISNQAALSSVVTAFGEWTTPRYHEWSFQLGSELYLKDALQTALAQYDVFNLHFDGTISRYNGDAWRMNFKYALDETLADRTRWRTFQTLHGPDFSLEYFPNQRWRWSLGTFYHFSQYGRDPDSGPDRRSGHIVGAYAKLSMDAPNPRLLPNFKYQYDHNAALGQNFISDSNSFLLGMDWRIFERTRFNLNAGISFVNYNTNVKSRFDAIKVGTIGLMHWFEPHIAGMIDVSVRQNDSNVSTFLYNRSVVTTGLTYRI